MGISLAMLSPATLGESIEEDEEEASKPTKKTMTKTTRKTTHVTSRAFRWNSSCLFAFVSLQLRVRSYIAQSSDISAKVSNIRLPSMHSREISQDSLRTFVLKAVFFFLKWPEALSKTIQMRESILCVC